MPISTHMLIRVGEMISFLNYVGIYLKHSYVYLQLWRNALFWNVGFLCSQKRLIHRILRLEQINSLSHNSVNSEATLTLIVQDFSDPYFYFRCLCLLWELQVFTFPPLDYCTILPLIFLTLTVLFILQILKFQNAIRTVFFKQDTDQIQLQATNLNLLPLTWRITHKLFRWHTRQFKKRPSRVWFSWPFQLISHHIPSSALLFYS